MSDENRAGRAPRRPPARTFLYVPGDQTERLAKSDARGADAVVVDLEDAVLPDAKPVALHNAIAWLRDRDPRGPQAWVRINSSALGLQEVERLAGETGLAGVFIPKVESVDAVDTVRRAGRRDHAAPLLLAPLIESAVGLVHCEDIASARGVLQLHLGEIDLAADLQLDPDSSGDQLLFARSRVVVASRYAGLIAPAAPVSTTIDDAPQFTAETRSLKRLGFFGRDCIHPDQVRTAQPIFSPDQGELSWARDVLAGAERSPGAFRDSTGALVDEAVLRRARHLLATHRY